MLQSEFLQQGDTFTALLGKVKAYCQSICKFSHSSRKEYHCESFGIGKPKREELELET